MAHISQFPKNAGAKKPPKSKAPAKTAGKQTPSGFSSPSTPAKEGLSPQQAAPSLPGQGLSQPGQKGTQGAQNIANQITGGNESESGASQVAQQVQKRTMSAMMAIPEAAIMLPIALLLDAAGLICFILSLFGVGIPLSFMLDFMGMFSIGFWVLSRGFFKGATEQIISNMTEKIGGQSQGQKSSGSMGKVAKKGIKAGAGAVRFLVAMFVELVPFLGDIMPSWTILVVSELMQGEMK